MRLKKEILLLPLLFFISCSSSIEETREEDGNGEGTYIFDDIPENETGVENESLETNTSYFLIQIGAFTTKQRAQNFAEDSKDKIGKEVTVSYSSDVNLFVVQLSDKFATKKEAEVVRNQVREEFKDAWIVSVQK